MFVLVCEYSQPLSPDAKGLMRFFFLGEKVKEGPQECGKHTYSS